MATLKKAKLDKADCLLVVTREDNVNLMVAQIGRIFFETPVVLARVFDPAREAIYKEFDIDTISPTQLSADCFLQKIEARQKNGLDNGLNTAHATTEGVA